jgi:hypothetical protein
MDQMNEQHCPLIKYQAFFSRVEKPSDDTNSRLFLMNKQGLKHLSPDHGGREFVSMVGQNRVHKLKDPLNNVFYIGDPDVICLAMADDILLYKKVTGGTYVEKPANNQDQYWLLCIAIRKKTGYFYTETTVSYFYDSVYGVPQQTKTEGPLPPIF